MQNHSSQSSRDVHFLRLSSKFVWCLESAYLKQKRLTFLATRPRYLGIISPVDRFFYQRGPAANLSRLQPECFLPPLPSRPFLSPHPTFPYTMHFLLGFCLLTSFFSFSLHVSAWVARWGTAVYFPLTACSDNLAPFRGTRFGACEVSPPRRLSRGQVRFTWTRIFCRFGNVTARRHLCREHPKGPTTPDPWSPLSPEEFEIARHRPFWPLGRATGMWRANYRRSFCVFRLATCVLNKELECLILGRRNLINAIFTDYLCQNY